MAKLVNNEVVAPDVTKPLVPSGGDDEKATPSDALLGLAKKEVGGELFARSWYIMVLGHTGHMNIMSVVPMTFLCVLPAVPLRYCLLSILRFPLLHGCACFSFIVSPPVLSPCMISSPLVSCIVPPFGCVCSAYASVFERYNDLRRERHDGAGTIPVRSHVQSQLFSELPSLVEGFQGKVALICSNSAGFGCLSAAELRCVFRKPRSAALSGLGRPFQS